MQKLFYLLISSICTLGSPLNAQIKFENLGSSMKPIVEKAQKEEKHIFVDVYTDWCRPCKLMDQTAFQDSAAGAYFNATFINVKANVTAGQEAVWLKDSLKINSYPTLLIFNPSGELVNYTKGAFTDGLQLIDFAQKSMQPEFQYILLKQEYLLGNRDIDFITKFITASYYAAEAYDQIVENFFSKIPKASWGDQQYWSVIEAGASTTQSELVGYIADNYEYVRANNGDHTVQNVIRKVISYDLRLFQHQGIDPNRLASLQTVAQKTGEEAMLLPLQISLALDAKKWDLFYQQVAAFKNSEASPEHSELYNSIAWSIISETTLPNDEQLELAQHYAALALKYQPEPYIKDTYACVRYRQGFIEEAIALERDVLQEASQIPEYGEIIPSFQANLNKMINRQKLFE